VATVFMLPNDSALSGRRRRVCLHPDGQCRPAQAPC
jgi:hypothetical protein